uniref:Mini spindles, isoform B n=2 Tax=Drosophila melanogaster TaxID=7227 RepID=E1JIM4_DROME|nr:mini spindles, isoform B [Drosophila melanogaster]NP_001247131.1 mini spindles, isoform F [Drosophila melanogaster]ACZ94923.1 mini spindles, isoform B [Drosophila melanogaster]AFH06449.1 mini spindles, isoform F [Drosophila melanogaster]|eukprot:NP_001163627.1 mini spindles, isoform B [Drosophila melanogaster]
MAEDTEYKKLPVEERCVHKLWKARVDGYEEAAKIFRELDDEKSPEWSKFAGLIKKMVVDSNALAQEKGLEAALIFVENSGLAGRTVGDVMTGIVQKCIAAPKTKTKELSVQVALMYVEIEKQEAVVEELVKGMEAKNPKIVSACVAATTLALREFGHKVIGVKPLIKKLAPLMSDRDKTVRDEGKQLAVEIYRWIGAAMKAQISTLPQVTLKELEDEFDKLKGERVEPSRYLKSQQEKQAKIADAAATEDAYNEDDGEAGVEEIDPMDLLDPVDILSKMPKDFYDKLEEKKWTLRKESLEVLEKLLTDHPKLENGEYGALVSALKKVITKDSNVVLVAMAGKCLALLAKGLAKRFSNYASACVPSLLEKFKEKKPNVVTALREAIDAIYASTSLEAQQESIVESLSNKNPSVKSETALFIARALTRTQPTALNKKLLKLLTTSLVKTLNEPDPTVRDSSAEALGTLIKLMGDKAVTPLLADVDPLKMAKIKECQEKAEIKIKVAGPKKETRPASAPTAKAAAPAKTVAGSVDPKPVTRPATTGARKVLKKPATVSGGGATSAPTAALKAGGKPLATEREITPEELQEKSEEILPAEILNGLVDSNWKNRLAAVEQLLGEISGFDAKQAGISQILIRTISGRKPGLKEMNFQVLKFKLDIIRSVAENYPLTTTTVDLVINEIIEKLADAKNGAAAADVLSAFAEATKLEYVVGKVLSFAFEQKSPKVQSEAFNWVNRSIIEFGFQLQPKTLIEDVRKGVQSTNPTVRASAIQMVGTMSMYMGKALMMFFDSEKPALKSQIQVEFDKNVGEKPPKPVRGVQRSSGGTAGNSPDNEDDDGGAAGEEEPINMADLLPRVDIAPQITEALLKEMSDKDWKTRNEGLTKLQAIISEARLIKPSIGDLAPALAHRLVDSNAKIAQTTLAICEQLATAMGAGCRNHVRNLFPGFLHALGDNKSFVRAAALNCINSFGEKGGYKEFFESEMIADALKGGSPALKTELWAWLADKLPGLPPKSVSKEDIHSMVPHLYAHICDRNADVRKNANEAVLGIMIHLGFDAMNRALDKQKPASKKDILAALEKARPNLPVKPLPKGKHQAPIPEEPKLKTVRGGGAGGAPGIQKSATARVAGGQDKQVPARKKDEDIDTSPLLCANSAKNQRLLDEQKMKVLKWTFVTPREEFTELLRDQMMTANVNKALIANMFHDDFRYHLKVIEQLSEDLAGNSKALVCNLDLILKWLTLRFYDTNPSVLIKGLEYLVQVFQVLIDEEYILAENEGSSFVPHLLLKIGDPKDAVRNGVRRVLRQVILVFPFVKVFGYVMEGLKSKNARQRTECLDELTFLIESYGMNICPQSAVREIARQISDRDNSVRNAALNCIVQVFFLSGEKTYKMIGHLNEKDLSMLDERIKRAKKTKKPTPPPSVDVPAPQRHDSIEIEDAEVGNGCDELPPPDEDGTFDQAPSSQLLLLQQQLQQLQQQAQQQKPSGPFGLDSQVISEIEKDWVRVDQMEQKPLLNVDISSLDEPIKVRPTRAGIHYPQEKFDRLISRQHYMQQTLTTSPSSTAGMTSGVSPYRSPMRLQHQQPQQQLENNIPNLADVLPKHDPQLVKVIKGVSSTDTLKARAAINELAAIIEAPEKQAVLRDYEEIFIQNVLAQFKNLSQIPSAQSVVVYQPLLSILYTFFHANILGKTLSVACIKNLMSALLNLMADPKLAVGDDSQYNKVINGICLKVLDKVDFTNLNCALIRLLRETCPEAKLPKFTDLLMKCIWRNVKMLPERSNELNYDAVILEVHEFMLALPSTWWQNRPSDTPMRTIKTILHNMAKVKGNAILQHLNQIPTHSELHTYLIRILKNFQKDGSASGIGASPQRAKEIASKRISHQTHDTVSQIFKLISDRDTKQQGLQKLYDFKQQNPDIDLSTFLQGSSAPFHKYIEEGLAEIERNQNAGSTQDNRTAATRSYLTDVNYQNNGPDPDFWMDRLQYHMTGGAAKLASARSADDGSHMLDNKVVDENLCLNGMNAQKASLIKREKRDMSPNRLQHLQAKLAQIKKENHAQ